MTNASGGATSGRRSAPDLGRSTGSRGLSVDPRVAAAVIRAAAWTVGLAGVVWGMIYLLLGLPGAAVFPFGFTAASLINAGAFWRHRRIRVFGAIEVALILVVPVVLSIYLGGMLASGMVAVWALVAPIGALLVLGRAWAAATFVAFVAMMAATVFTGSPAPDAVGLNATGVTLFAFLDVVAVSLVAFWVIHVFATVNQRLARERERLLEVEQAYVKQEAMMRQHERLATLGQLSAGVAHELNNPAAAAGRASGQLGGVLDRLVGDAATLLRSGITPDVLEWARASARAVERDDDPVERGDREERVARWLETDTSEDAWDMATDLAGLGFDAGGLDGAAERFGRPSVVVALRWIVDASRARELVREVRTSAGRMSEIVGALKGYSHMDRAEAGTVDVERGLDDTLLILRGKLTGLEVVRERAESLPSIEGYPGELNQVWTNLIANAAEALSGSGTLTVRTRAAADAIVVEVEDDGPGIPPELVDRVFDPFVTTKKPGEGMGLGLNLTHQIVAEHHGGRISVQSRPGCTRFVVRLPVERRPVESRT